MIRPQTMRWFVEDSARVKDAYDALLKWGDAPSTPDEFNETYVRLEAALMRMASTVTIARGELL